MAWQSKFLSTEVPEGARRFFAHGKREIGVIRHRGRLYAVLNFCPHAGAPVCQGEVDHPVFVETPGGAGCVTPEQPTLRCPWHHWEFDLASGDSLCSGGPRLKTYAVREEAGQIWVDC